MKAHLLTIASWVVFIALFSALACQAESLRDLESIASQAKNFNEFFSNPILIAKYGKAVKAYYHKDRFRCETYENVIADLKAISSKLPELGNRLWEPVHLDTFKISVFNTELDSDSVESEPNEFVMRPITRRLHGIWSDPNNQSCLKDGCEKEGTKTPERWAIALKNSQLYNVEKTGIYSDLSLLVTPVLRMGKVYPLITLGGGPQLLRPVFHKNKFGVTEKTTLLGEWIKHATAKMPSDWNPFIIAKTGHPWEHLQRQMEWAEQPASAANRVIGTPNEFSPQDKLAFALEETSPRACLKGEQGTLGGVFLGLMNPVNRNLAGNLPERAIDPKDPDSVRDALKDVSYGNPGQLALIPNSQIRTTESTLTQLFADDPDPGVRRAAGLALDNLMDRENALGARSPASEGPRTPYAPPMGTGLSDPDPGVRAIAGLNMLKNGIDTPATVSPVINAMTPPNATPSGPGSNAWQPWQDPNFVQQAQNQVLKPNTPMTIQTASNLLDKLTNLPTREERKRAAYAWADYMRNALYPDPIARALFQDSDRDLPKLKEFRQDFADHLRDEPPHCDPGPTTEAREDGI